MQVYKVILADKPWGATRASERTRVQKGEEQRVRNDKGKLEEDMISAALSFS